jgi:hypothetical protein
VVVAQAVRMKNKMSGLLMEVGAEYSKQRLDGKKYFSELLDQLEEVPESVKDLLRLSRGSVEMFETMQRQLLHRLQKDPLVVKRVELLRRSGRGDGAELGAGGLRSAAVPLHSRCGELLRAEFGAGVLGGQAVKGDRFPSSAMRTCKRC